MKLLFVSSLAVAAVLAQAADLRSVFAPIYRQSDAAQKAKDMKALETHHRLYHSKSLVYIRQDGSRHSSEEMFEMMKAQVPKVDKFAECASTIQKISDLGSAVDLTVMNHVKILLMGPDKKRHVIVDDEVTLDTWGKENGKWKLRRIKSLNVKTYLDGKIWKGK